MNFRQKFAEYNQLNTIGLGFSPVGAAWYRRKSNTETNNTRSTEVNPIPRPSTGIGPEEEYTNKQQSKHRLELPDSWYAPVLIFTIISLITILVKQTLKVAFAI